MRYKIDYKVLSLEQGKIISMVCEPIEATSKENARMIFVKEMKKYPYMQNSFITNVYEYKKEKI